MADSPNQPSFEAAFTQLQETVQRLEAGNLPLDETTRLYEEGMRMAQVCNQLLSAAEQRIVQLHDALAAEQRPGAEDEDDDGPYGGEDDEDEDSPDGAVEDDGESQDDEEEPGPARRL